MADELRPLECTSRPARPGSAPGWGVVAVITHVDQFLVIRRSQVVRAPGAYCFPGGGVEPGESHEGALLRELDEELGAPIRALRPLWHNTTASGVRLAWWRAELLTDAGLLRPNPLEVESVHWMTATRMLGLPELLATNREFLAALARGEFRLD
jgi:8-oxo-dGTP pyrophosphatase MutT (NUDIX family)